MKNRLLITALLLISFNFFACAQTTTTSSSKIGLLWTSWGANDFDNYSSYLDKLETWGVNYLSLNPTYFIDTYEEGVVDRFEGKAITPDLSLQKSIIKELIQRRFYINYRPHVDPIKFVIQEPERRAAWNSVPGGGDWRGQFKKLDPTSPTIGYKERIVLPGLQMLAEAIREQGAPLTPIRFDLGAELMDAMLNYPQHWIDLRDEVRVLLDTKYSDVKQHIVLGHNFCHHFGYLMRLPNHIEYLKRISPNQQIDVTLLNVDRQGVTNSTRLKIGKYIAGLDAMSLSQYLPLDIFKTDGVTTPDDVCKALLLHEKNLVEEILIKELGIKPNDLPELNVGEYGMGWRGLAAPNVWDREGWKRAGAGDLILNDEQQKRDATIAIAGIIKYVNPSSGTQFKSFLLWFGGAPYDLLNITGYSNWYNADAAELLKNYWKVPVDSDVHAK